MLKKLLVLVMLILVGCNGGEDFTTLLNVPDRVKCTAIVTWERPTERTNGEVLTVEELEKFTIYVNRKEDVDESTILFVTDLTVVSLVTWELTINPGPNYFYMTVTDTEGRSSTYSNILGKNCNPNS